MNWALSINKQTISDANLVEEPDRQLEDGEVRLRVDRFALTANNVTYAAFGEVMRYWEFFPGSDGRGRLPVWGFADVADSRCEGVEPGERVYGYFPAASELIVKPGRVRPDSFVDDAAHRSDLAAVYNRYVRCAADPSWSADLEPAQMVLKPLFVTAFLLDVFLREDGADGADTIILTSASSKTAIALAALLQASPMGKTRVLGLTSSGNASFVDGLDLYDEVVLYDAIEALGQDRRYCIVDFAGNGEVNRRLHTRLETVLTANIRVGGAHWDNSAPVADLPGVKPQFFFAPDHAKARSQAWGPVAFEQRYADAWSNFANRSNEMFEFREHPGADGALTVYNALVAGGFPARYGETIRVAG